MAYTYGKTGVKKRRVDVYIRAQAAYTAPPDLAGVAALRASATKVGEFQDKSVKWSIKPNDKVDLNDGTTKILDYLGHFEAKHVNNLIANNSYIVDTWEDRDVDVFLDDTVNEEWVALKDFPLHTEEDDTSGDVNMINLMGDKKVSAKTTFREKTDYSAFV